MLSLGILSKYINYYFMPNLPLSDYAECGEDIGYYPRLQKKSLGIDLDLSKVNSDIWHGR